MDERTDKIAKEDQESASTANEAFTITRKDKEITLDAGRSATTTFTVHSTKSIRGRAELLIEYKEGQPKGAAAKPASDRQEEPVEVKDPYDMPEGLEVDITGIREHEFGAGDTKEYAVHLRVLGGKESGGAEESGSAEGSGGAEGSGDAKGSSGAEGKPAPQAEGEGPAVKSNPLQVTVDGARPGPYWLRLDMVDVENPDEMRAKGPKVSFVVPGRPFPWWIVAVAAVVLVIVAVGVVLLLRSRVNIPDVRGQPVAEAEATLQAAGLMVTATMTTTSETVMRGWVVSTVPGPTTRVRRDSGVTLILSGGPRPVAVPDVLGLPEARAVEDLMHAGFEVGPTSTVPDPSATPGWVVATTPRPGTLAEKGSEVTLVLSSGPEMVQVPEVEGKTEKDAQEMLADAGLVAVRGASAISGEVALDHVIDADPEPGKLVPRGSRVRVIVSLGPNALKVDWWVVEHSGKDTGTLTVEYHHGDVDGLEGCLWDFGDGGSSETNDDRYTYTRDGTYDVTLTIFTSAGPVRLTKADYITVEPIKPRASFEFSGAAPLSRDSWVTFTDTSAEEPTSWLWDFGDGSEPSTERSPVHQFQWAGTFTVTLEVTNSAGGRESEQSVTIGRPECLERSVTDWVSEENGGPQTSCPDGTVAWGVQCRGERCDEMSLICCRYHLGTDETAQTNDSGWSPEYGCTRSWSWSSFSNVTRCTAARPLSEPGKWLKGLQCSGGYCSMVKLEYLQTERLKWKPEGQCSDATSLSSTKGATSYATCNPGEYVSGLTCDKDDCSQIRLLCCPAQ